MGRRLEPGHLAAFQRRLLEEEREAATIEKYLREVGAFAAWAGSEPVTKELACRWKERLAASGCQPATINGKLAALNKFFAFLGWTDCQVKYLKVQRRMFRSSGRELSRKDYTCLVEAARELGVPEEKSVLLQHLLLSHHGEPEFGAAVRPMCAEAEMLNLIDLMDSRMEIYREAFEEVEPGQFTKRIFALDKKVYRHF